MLIEASRRAETAAREMLALVDAGGVACGELREMLHISRATTAVLNAAQTAAASIISKSERHGDGGVGVLAEAAGLSRRDARGQVKTAEAIAAAPSIRDAVESGRVSQANARRLAEAVKRTSADAVEADTGLLAKAAALAPEQFAKEARRWTADHQHDDGESDYRRLRAKRSVRIWDGEDGTVQLHGVFDPVTGKRIENRLRAEARRMYDADKKLAGGSSAGGSGDLPGAGRRTYEQCMADAFDNMASGAAARTPATTASAGSTVADTDPVPGTAPANCTDADPGQLWASATGPGSTTGAGQGADGPTFTGSGAGQAGGMGVGRSFADISVIAHIDNAGGKLIAELPDGARLPEAVLEELVCNARLTGFVYGTTGTPLWQTKSSRTATEGQRRALLNHWGGCFHCAARPDMCQIHHIVPVSRGGATKIDNMVPVCWDCHNKIHHQHWQIRMRPDAQHTLHPPNHTHYGPAHAPEQPLLFTASEPQEPKPALQGAGTGQPRSRDSARSSGT